GVGEEAELVHPGVVDEDVERAARGLDRRARGVGIGDVEMDGVAVDLGRDLRGAVVVEVADPHLGPLRGQAANGRRSDPAGAAGYERLPVLEPHRRQHMAHNPLQVSRSRKIRISPATVIAFVALLIALGGAAYAAFKLPKNSVGTKQIKSNAVTGAKV